MPHTRKKSFYLKPSSTKLAVGTTLIIIQQESEKMIWKADFKTNFLQRVRFELKIFTTRHIWIKKITTRQILN